ncbi:hypothetical protein M9H77_04853 [Catharanthus roseus]|uniref:Uncharacterized protein n=1 Tax=Catharanthus roseus TaxID=4058 RepID=A0ACC0CFF0_CATRO|nr:hypothetical protein M9H77_04853 [Catharanthus roseus]
MLRAKQLGTLSQSARTFFLSGSRCSAGDGSSCTCSEDETCVSRRPQRQNGVLHPQISPTVASRPSITVGSLISRDASVQSHKPDSVNCSVPVPVPQVPASGSLGRAECVNYARLDAHSVVHSSPPIADQLVRTGIAAVNLFSDLVNYKIPSKDGSGLLGSTQNFVIEDAKATPAVMRASNVKTFRKEKDGRRSCAVTDAGPSVPNKSSAAKGGMEKSSSAKGVADLSNNATRKSVTTQPILPNSVTGNSGDTQGSSSDSFERKRSVPHRSRNYSNHLTPNARRGEMQLVGDITDGYTRASRETKVSTGAPPVARQFPGSGNTVGSVSRVLQQLKWGPAAEDALRKLKCSLDVFQANQILKQIQDHTVAHGFFYWLKRQPGFKHDGHTYTTMVGILGRARQFGAINKLLGQMVSEGCPPNVVTYNRLIHSYGRANYLNEALNVFNKMQKAGCEPDRVTYCTLIDIHAKAGYLDIAMDMYQRMQEAGLSPDTFTYSVIINCLGKAGHLAAAQKLFCEMVNQGCIPNLVTYNIMIALQAKARNYQSALQLYRDMQNAGFEPDKVTYSIVMEVLGQCGYLEEAEAVFVQMKRKNWVPDEPVYGLLVDLWGKAGNAEKAWEWYQAMLNAGLCPNVPTCNSLLSAFLRVHRLSDAYNLLQSMLCLGLNPSLQTYTLLLSCCTEAKTSFDMGFCGQLMAVTGHPAHMFLLSMPASGPDGQNVRDHASNFLDLMHSEDRESKRGLVDAVVDFLHKTGLKEEAGSVWEVAAKKNVYPDAVREKSSCYWLINLHVMSDGTAVTALSRTLAFFRRQMLNSGICPSRIDIVTGWGRRSRVTGSSLVRQAVEDLLNVFSFPFFTENGNSGCFVGCGEPLNRWLHQSYIERMHLL